MSRYIFVFVVVLISLFGIYTIQTDIASESAQHNSRYSDYLSEATYDAAHVIADRMETSGNITAMPHEQDRQGVLDVFYKSLSLDFGYITDEDLSRLKIYIPVVALIDTNGYYIVYNAEHTGTAGTKLDTIITPLNTWTLKTANYIVKYNLGTNVSVTDMATGIIYEGNYRDVYNELGCPDELYNIGFSSVQNGHAALEGESVKSDENAKYASSKKNWDTGTDGNFFLNQRSVIIPETKEKIEYYINQHNKVASEYHIDYIFTMPLTQYDDWSRMLKEPTCIAFMQGVRPSNTRDYLNIFSIGGGDVSKVKQITYKGTTTRTYTLSDTDDGSATGYVAGARDVANNSAEVHYEDSAATSNLFYHEHYGDPNSGSGCYTIPVYHVHTKECYKTVPHVHLGKNNEHIVGKDKITTEEGGGGGCYTIPYYHQHTDACYEDVFHKHYYYSISGVKIYTDESSLDGNTFAFADFDGDGYVSSDATKTLSAINPRTGTNEWAETDFFGCYSNRIMHYHNSNCYETVEKTDTHLETKQIYHTHVEPDIYYRTPVNAKTGDVSTITNFTYVKDEPIEYTAPIQGTYTLEVWGGKGSSGNGSYCVANIKLSARSKLYVYVGNNVSGNTEYGGNSATYISTVKGAKATDSSVYIVAGGNGTGGHITGFATDGRITEGVNEEKGYARISFGGQKMTPEEAMQKGAVAYYVDTNTSYVDESGTTIYCCYTVTYEDEQGKEHSTYAEGYKIKKIEKTCGKLTYEEAYEKAKNESDSSGNKWDSEQLEEVAASYASKTGTVSTSVSETSRSYKLKCNKVYEGFILACGMEEGDYEGRELICGMISATDEEENPALKKSVAYWGLSCGHKEGELMQEETTTCGKLSEEDAIEYGLSPTAEYYLPGCGLTSGQRISKTQYDIEQQEKRAAGY